MHFQKRVEQLKGGDKINVMSLYGDYGTFSSEEQELSQLILQKAAYNISIPEKMVLDVKKKWENFSGIFVNYSNFELFRSFNVYVLLRDQTAIFPDWMQGRDFMHIFNITGAYFIPR